MAFSGRTEHRVFWGLTVGVVLLAALAVAVAVSQSRRAHYRTDDTPTAVVYNYLLALRRGDFDRAYDLLGNVPCKPDRTWFAEAQSPSAFVPPVDIVGEQQTGNRAVVMLDLTYSDGPFGVVESGRFTERVVLERQGGRWKIVRLPGMLWPFPPMNLPAGQCPSGGD